MKESGNKRYRQWSTILYPESAAENWRSLLDEQHIQYIVSPLHDKDVNPDGEVKKEHWHIAFVFDGVKSYDQVLYLTELINAVSPQRVLSLRGLVRYFAHLDNPEKFQYNVDQIECHNGIDIDECLKQTCTEKHQILRDILYFIEEKDIREFWDLLIMVEEYHPEWLDLLMEGYTLFINSALTSRRNMIRSKRL